MRRWTIGLAAVLVAVLLVAACAYQLMNARSFQLAGRLVDRVDTADKLVALTLDDGPTAATPEVLRILRDAGVPATFYLNGKDLTENPAAGTAIAEAGHEIGNHTYSHRRMVLVSPSTVAAEIERTDEQIRRTGYRGPITFRPPFGKKLWTLPAYLSDHDRTTVMWDVEPDSASSPTADQIVSATADSVRPGSIILLHVMFDGRSASRAAIPGIVSRLRADGYRFVTVTQPDRSRPMTSVVGFPPILDDDAHTLILGNAPSVISLQRQQYYANPRNAFWRITGDIYGFAPDAPYEKRTAALLSHGIAVWDVLKECRRAGSLDSAVEPNSMVVNDFRKLFDQHRQITRVIFNGAAAEKNFDRLVRVTPDLRYQRLPSTSPAQTMRYADKLAAWRTALAD